LIGWLVALVLYGLGFMLARDAYADLLAEQMRGSPEPEGVKKYAGLLYSLLWPVVEAYEWGRNLVKGERE
jgi:hypothetical protein